jgi:hypothetical protein
MYRSNSVSRAHFMRQRGPVNVSLGCCAGLLAILTFLPGLASAVSPSPSAVIGKALTSTYYDDVLIVDTRNAPTVISKLWRLCLQHAFLRSLFLCQCRRRGAVSLQHSDAAATVGQPHHHAMPRRPAQDHQGPDGGRPRGKPGRCGGGWVSI